MLQIIEIFTFNDTPDQNIYVLPPKIKISFKWTYSHGNENCDHQKFYIDLFSGNIKNKYK